MLNQNTLPSTPGNQSATTLNNTAQFTATGVTAINSTPAQTVAIVEPALSLTKQIAPNNGGVPGTYANTLSSQDAGNVFFYKVVITHTGGPAAFDLGLTDAFSAKLTSLTIYSAASTLTTVGGTVRSLALADLLLTGNTLTFASGLDVDLAIGGTITVEIRANAAGTVVPGRRSTTSPRPPGPAWTATSARRARPTTPPAPSEAGPAEWAPTAPS